MGVKSNALAKGRVSIAENDLKALSTASTQSGIAS
jgi:hypothetical protein